MFRVVTFFALALAVAGQSVMPALSPVITPTFNSTGPAIIPTLSSAVPAITPTFNSTGPAIIPTLSSAVPAITPTFSSLNPAISPIIAPALSGTPPPAPAVPTAPITPTAPVTLAPGVTLTLPPLLANIPIPEGGFPDCWVCSVGYYVKDKEATVDFNGLVFTCRDIEAAGFQGRIPAAFCTKDLTERVLQDCGCDELFPSAAPSGIGGDTARPTSAGVTMMGLVSGSVLAAASSVFLSL